MVSKSMKNTPAMACLKTMLTIFSFIFVIIGIALLVAGALARVKFQTYFKLSSENFSNAPWVMIAIGAFVVLVGIMGCCATIKGNTCLLRTYGFLLAVIFICELGGAIAAIILRKNVEDSFKKGMTTALQKYDADKSYKSAVDNAQQMLHCCGVNNYTDWTTIASKPSNTVPESCCSNKTWCDSHKSAANTGYVDVSTMSAQPPQPIYTKGCHSLALGVVESNLGIIIGSMFGVAFFQLIGLILACCLASTINSNKYELV